MLTYNRHLFAWLVEAADDICYNIVDLEDAHRLGIVEHNKCCDMLEKIIDNNDVLCSKRQHYSEKSYISYLRAKTINYLIHKCSDMFMSNIDNILNFKHKTPIYDILKQNTIPLQELRQFSRDKIYNYKRVVEIELDGFNVMYELLNCFVFAILEEKPDKTQLKVLQLLPTKYTNAGSNYEKVMCILDYMSGMTDNFATDLYKRIKGIEIGLKL